MGRERLYKERGGQGERYEERGKELSERTEIDEMLH